MGFSGAVVPSRTANESIPASAIMQVISVMASKPTQSFSGTLFFQLYFVNYMLSMTMYEN